MSRSNLVSKRKFMATSPIIRSNDWKPRRNMLTNVASKWACSTWRKEPQQMWPFLRKGCLRMASALISAARTESVPNQTKCARIASNTPTGIRFLRRTMTFSWSTMMLQATCGLVLKPSRSTILKSPPSICTSLEMPEGLKERSVPNACYLLQSLCLHSRFWTSAEPPLSGESGMSTPTNFPFHYVVHAFEQPIFSSKAIHIRTLTVEFLFNHLHCPSRQATKVAREIWRDNKFMIE